MRLRSRGKVARPYIWRLMSLVRVLRPSTRPEFHWRVSPLRTAWEAWRVPFAKEGRSGWAGAAGAGAGQGAGRRPRGPGRGLGNHTAVAAGRGASGERVR